MSDWVPQSSSFLISDLPRGISRSLPDRILNSVFFLNIAITFTESDGAVTSMDLHMLRILHWVGFMGSKKSNYSTHRSTVQKMDGGSLLPPSIHVLVDNRPKIPRAKNNGGNIGGVRLIR